MAYDIHFGLLPHDVPLIFFFFLFFFLLIPLLTA